MKLNSSILFHATAELEEAFAEQARFTSDAAHELRTPVSVLLGLAHLPLGREGSSEEYRLALVACRRSARRMQALIESLLELSILDASRDRPERGPCDLAELGRDNLEMIRLLADERKLTLKGDFMPAPCLADAGSLSQLVTNLLSNAVKFTPPGGEIRIATRRENGCAVLSVTDSGVGIPATALPHIFDPFYRVDASRSRATGGAGLGLSISQSIAEAHGGTIAVESTPAQGSTFTLRLPAMERV